MEAIKSMMENGEAKLTQYNKMAWTNECHSFRPIQREIFQLHFLAARDSSYPRGFHVRLLPLEPSPVSRGD